MYLFEGQTWTLTVIRLIRRAKELEEGIDSPFNDFYDQNPFMETLWGNGETGADKFNKLKPPRIMKTHLPYESFKAQLEKHPNLRVIQIIRNPKDTLASWFHHLRSDGHLGGFNGTWDQFFEEFKNNRLIFGDFFDVNANWYKFNKGRESSLILMYEEMKKGPKSHVIKIAKFLGHDLSDKAIDLIVEKSHVKSAGKKFNTLFKEFPAWNSERSNFVRKGEVGDWVNYFSEEQSEHVEQRSKEILEPLGLTFEYSI